MKIELDSALTCDNPNSLNCRFIFSNRKKMTENRSNDGCRSRIKFSTPQNCLNNEIVEKLEMIINKNMDQIIKNYSRCYIQIFGQFQIYVYYDNPSILSVR